MPAAAHPMDVMRTGCSVLVGVKEGRVLLTGLGPAVDLGELHATDGSVDVGHAGVESDDLVLVLNFHALVAQELDLASELGALTIASERTADVPQG